MDRLFQLGAHGMNVGTAVLAGLTAFVTMAYILCLNPLIQLKQGSPSKSGLSSF